MKTLRFVLPALAVLGACLLASFVRGPASAREEAPERGVVWEYRVDHPETDLKAMSDALNRRGGDGWEFAGTVVLSHIDTTKYLIYKRPKR